MFDNSDDDLCDKDDHECKVILDSDLPYIRYHDSNGSRYKYNGVNKVNDCYGLSIDVDLKSLIIDHSKGSNTHSQ